MAKYSFDSIPEFVDYVETYFSGPRDLNYGDDEFEAKEYIHNGDVAYIKFEVNDDFDALAVCLRIPAQSEWLGFFPKFSHHSLDKMTEVLSEVNNDNHDRNDRHPTSAEKLEDETGFDGEWMEVPSTDE